MDCFASLAMTMERVHAYRIGPQPHPRSGLSQPFAYSRAWYDARAAMVVEIETDDGLVGWGRAALTRFAAR
jgi:L-alanine-DL-glutamate epimerase-like enolase superfamily enzyme